MKKILGLLVTIFLVTTLTVTLTAQEQRKLQIVRGGVDTVENKVHYIVGVATPGSQIKVNGVEVKQYSTGSFGAQIELKLGDNSIKIESSYGALIESESLSIYYRELSPKESEKRESEKRGLYTTPVVMTKEGAYLNYGAGEDRLGGAKINFLASGIKMELMGIEKNLYKVRLSEGRYGFIPQEFADLLPIGEEPPFSLTGSWTLSNRGTADLVRINLEERLPYIIYSEPALNRLVVELHGAACNSNWITQMLDTEAIESVDLKQTQSDVLQVIVQLKERYNWGYRVDYSGTALEIRVNHTPKAVRELPKNLGKRRGATLRNLVVGLDAGHGGSANGAVSPSGLKEKELNLAMVYLLKEEIEKRGGRVVLSRESDIDLSMQERKDIFREAEIDLLISIHCNAGGTPLQEMGSSTYYRHIENREFAKTVLESMLELGVKNFGLVGNFNFSLIAPADYPAILVETLFMSSLPEEELLASPQFQKRMMERVAIGLENYIEKVKKGL